MSTYSTINPATGEKLAEFEVVDDATMDGLISSSAVAYASWRSTALEARTDTLRRVADLHLERLDDLAALLTLEMGKPVVQAEGEVKLVASIYRYYADNAAKFLADEELDIVGGGTAVVRTEAIGPLLGIMPWNFPYYQAARFIAPNLALGNTVIVKHARNCPQSALAIESVLRDAGVPDGAYLNAFLTTDQVAAVIADPRVQGVSLTGSERAGSAVGEVAGRHMKRYVLELGGSDPFIVLDDADIDEAVAAGVANRVSNGGQTCTASKRFIVVDSVYEEFTKKFVDALTSIEPADPTLRETKLGPLATVGAADELAEIVQDAVERGARLHVAPGAARQGAFVPPSVLTDVVPGMRAHDEELFGPTAVLHRVPSSQAAVELANSSPFGLASSVFTRDGETARQLAEQLEVGMVWINSTSKSAPDLPFGGVKRSGVGRELARFGIDEFANKKLIRTPVAL